MLRAHHASQSEEQAAEPIEHNDDRSLAEWHILEKVVPSQNKSGENPQVPSNQPDLDMKLEQDRRANTVLFDATRSLYSACKKAAPMRQDATLMRTKVEYATANYQHAQSRVRDSQQELFDEMTATLRALPDQRAEAMDRLNRLYENMVGETAALEMRAKSLADCGVSASRTESALAKQDENVLQCSRDVLAALASTIPPPEGMDTGDAVFENVPEEAFEKVPAEVINGSALAYYYSSKADAEIMAEREQSLNFDYQEELAVRTFRQDRDEVLSITDEDFEKAYRADFDSARKDYEQALVQVGEAYKVCKDLGILTEEHTDAPVTTPEPSEDGVAFDAPLPFRLRVHESLPRVYSHPVLSRRTSSPTLFSATAGTVLSDPNPRTRSKADTAHKSAAIEHWIRDTSIASRRELESVAGSQPSSEHSLHQAIATSGQESSEQEAAPGSNNSAPVTPKAVGFLEQQTVARALTPDGDVGSESSIALDAVVA